MRILSISTLFPNPARPAFGNFVRNQMLAVTERDEVDLTMVSPVGIPLWPLSLREPGAIASAVSEILANPPKQQDVAETVSGFSWDRNGAAIVDIWQRAMALPRPLRPES